MEFLDAQSDYLQRSLFFEGYSRLRWGETGLNKVMEEPAIRSLMPDLTGKRVLDLGCGFGHVARYARQMGAAEVLGVDISDRMIQLAQQATEDPAITYAVIAMQDIKPISGQFDVIISSMALHYIDDYAAVVKTMATSLTHGGSFLFSIEHPIYTSLCKVGSLMMPVSGSIGLWTAIMMRASADTPGSLITCRSTIARLQLILTR